MYQDQGEKTMKIKLSEKCPKCGCQDKTIKRSLDPMHHAHATTGAVTCTKCGYVFKSRKDEEDKE
jgi:Cys-rich peptide (TIGR04165 family)